MRLTTFSAFALLLLNTLTTAYTGDMTYYTPSLGSCGITSHPNEDVVALSLPIMNNRGNSNANPKCGSYIGIWNPKTRKHFKAKVVDSCVGCKKFDIDVSEGLFRKVAPGGDGRVGGISWGGRMVGG